LKQVFNRLRAANLKMNFKKCKWFNRSIKLLGHIVDGETQTIKMDKSKIEIIENWIKPSTPKQLMKFLGLAGYYRKFIDQYSTIVAPLYLLLHADTKWMHVMKLLKLFVRNLANILFYANRTLIVASSFIPMHVVWPLVLFLLN
jgi:hypothetical protein